MLKIFDIVYSSGETDGFHLSENFHIGLNSDCPKRPVVIADRDSKVNIGEMAFFILSLLEKVKTAHLENQTSYVGEVSTRFTMQEFSLYPKNRPLTVEEYKVLVTIFKDNLSNFPSNILIQLATIPVLWPNGVMKNCLLHIQTPSLPGGEVKIHHMHKLNHSTVDYQYGYEEDGKYHLYPLFMHDSELDGQCQNSNQYADEIVLAGCGLELYDPHQYRGALLISTEKGMRYLQAIEICIDHKHQIAEMDIMKLTVQLAKKREAIPYYLSQVVSSNTIQINEGNLMATVRHADAVYVEENKLERKLKIECYSAPLKIMPDYSLTYFEGKLLGLICGANFSIIIQLNTLNSFVLNVNALDGDGKTLMHRVIENQQSSYEMTHRRLVQLLALEVRIDIPDASGKMIADYLYQYILEAIRKGNEGYAALEKYLRICQFLDISSAKFFSELELLQKRKILNAQHLVIIHEYYPFRLNKSDQIELAVEKLKHYLEQENPDWQAIRAILSQRVEEDKLFLGNELLKFYKYDFNKDIYSLFSDILGYHLIDLIHVIPEKNKSDFVAKMISFVLDSDNCNEFAFEALYLAFHKEVLNTFSTIVEEKNDFDSRVFKPDRAVVQRYLSENIKISSVLQKLSKTDAFNEELKRIMLITEKRILIAKLIFGETVPEPTPEEMRSTPSEVAKSPRQSISFFSAEQSPRYPVSNQDGKKVLGQLRAQ